MLRAMHDFSPQWRSQDFLTGGGGGGGKARKGGMVAGADPGFSWGGGRKRLCERKHITSAMPEVPYGRGPGPA